MEAAEGTRLKVQASGTKGLLRIIQSIPSEKAQPFKLRLAQVGSDRLDEIENPELAAQRTSTRTFSTPLETTAHTEF